MKLRVLCLMLLVLMGSGCWLEEKPVPIIPGEAIGSFKASVTPGTDEVCLHRQDDTPVACQNTLDLQAAIPPDETPVMVRLTGFAATQGDGTVGIDIVVENLDSGMQIAGLALIADTKGNPGVSIMAPDTSDGGRSAFLAGDLPPKAAALASGFCSDPGEPFSLVFTLTESRERPLSECNSTGEVQAGDTLGFDSEGSRASQGGTLSYSWRLVKKPEGSSAGFSSLHDPIASLVADKDGTYEAELVIVEEDGDASTLNLASRTAHCRGDARHNPAPTARIDAPSEVLVGETVEVDGSASSDPRGDPLTFAWSFVFKPFGSAAVFAAPTAATTSFMPDVEGNYIVRLVVSDGVHFVPHVVVIHAETPPDPGPPPRLVFGTAPPAEVLAGDTWPSFTVRVEDAEGNLLGSDNTTVIELQNVGGTAALAAGTLSRTVTGGIAVFDDLLSNEGGSITFDVADSLGALDATAVEGLSVTLILLPPRIDTFTATPASVAIGEESIFEWTLSEGPPSSLTLAPAGLNVLGLTGASLTPFPSGPAPAGTTQWYKLEATNAVAPREISEWEFVTSAGGPSGETVVDIAVLPGGASYVTGYFCTGCADGEGMILGAGEPNEATLLTAGGWDGYIARYNADGTLAWARDAGGTGQDVGWGVAALPDGSAVLLGYFSSPTITLGAGETNETTLTMAGWSDIFIARYSATGDLLWARGIGGQYSDTGRAIDSYADGTFVVTGYFASGGSAGKTVTFGAGEANETILTSLGTSDIFVAKYNPDGTLVWAKGDGGASSDIGTGVAALPDGSAVVTGIFVGISIYGGAITGQGNWDVFVSKYNSNGSLAWARGVGDGGSEQVNAIAALEDGSSFITGFIHTSTTFGHGDPNETTLVSAGNQDFFIARYNPDGTIAWARRAGGTGHDQGYSVSTLPDGSVLAAGFYCDQCVGEVFTTFGPGEVGETVLGTVGQGELFAAKFAANGDLLWVQGEGSTEVEAGRVIAVLPDGSALFAGAYCGLCDEGGTITIGAGDPGEAVLTTHGGGDIFLGKIRPINTRYLEIVSTGP